MTGYAATKSTANPQTAFPAMRQAGIPERSLADAYRNWWSVLVTLGHASDDELVRFVAWYGKRKGEAWNPARLWNVRNTDGSMRCRYVLSQFRSWEARQRKATRNTRTMNQGLREWAQRIAEG